MIAPWQLGRIKERKKKERLVATGMSLSQSLAVTLYETVVFVIVEHWNLNRLGRKQPLATLHACPHIATVYVLMRWTSRSETGCFHPPPRRGTSLHGWLR